MLKLILCPHCNLSGFLILHGYLYGYSETDSNRIRRGHRIFCSNRDNKNGCGKTFSVLKSTFIKNFVITAITLWCFLDNLRKGLSLIEAFRQTASSMGETNSYRLFRKFKNNQVRIRTYLSHLKDPPRLKQVAAPTIQTIVHLKQVFSHSLCPICDFQHHFQTSFL